MAKFSKIKKLEDLLKETDTKVDFDIVEDLKSLERAFGVLKAKDFRKKIGAIIQKYEHTEITVVRQVLLDECQKGNVNAIRLYAERFLQADTIKEDDGLIDVLKAKGKELFKNEF